MRSNKIFRLLGIAAILTILTACTDDDLIENYEVEEGRPIELKLNFKATAPKVVVSSRAELKDNAVNDLYVFIFKADGSLRTKQYYTGDELTTPSTGSQPNTTTEDNWVKIKTTTGTSRIYAIANVQASVNIYGGVVDAPEDQKKDLKTQLDGITTEEKLRALQLNILNNSVNRLSEFLVMAGAVKNGANCTIGITQNTSEKLVVKLRRLDSEINFKFEAGKKTYKDEKGEHPYCTSFEVTSYQVFNVPNKTYVLGRDNENDNLKEYVVTDGHDILDAAQEYSEEENAKTDFFHTEAVTTASNSFTFYMAENRKEAQIGDDGTVIDDYNDRELETATNKEKDKKSVRRTYVYAPDNGTYVLVTGKFFGYSDKYKDTNSQYSGEAEANVRYIIHLGGEDPNVKNQMDFDNFDIFRNSKYTYNVTVNGVDDIVVEVVTEKEENAPGAEGEVLFVNGSQKYILDAHYETVLLAFNKTQLQTGNSTNAGELFTYQIKTPYASYTSTYNNPYEGAKDEDWIRIVRNEIIDGENGKKVYSKKLGKHPDVTKPETYLTVEQFIKDLQGLEETDFDEDGNIVYTCHINEFYYKDNPVKKDVPASWKEFVNKPNREVHILNQVKDSGDKLSSIVSSAYVISQRSIQTFYATDKTEPYSAYGAETINETDALANYEYYKSQIDQWTNTDWNDGRNNFKSILSKIIPALDDSKEWSTYVDETTNGYKESNLQNLPIVNAMKGDYERAYLACMQRNRDLDGDGHISDDEIRWYLPAQNQYVGMFLGEPGLSPESRLYPYNEQDYKHIHYVSSTVYDDKDNDDNDGLVVYWAEEAVSTSHGKQDTYADKDCWKMNHDHNNHQYRCMRNLYDGKEVDLNNADGPKNFYKVEANTTDGIAGYNITVPYLNKASLRTELIGFGDLGIHRDDDPIKSRVATGGFYTGKKINDATFNDWNVYKIAYATSTGYNWSNDERPYKIERPTQPEGKDYYLTFIQGNGGWEGTLQIAGQSGLWDINHDGKITCGFAAGTKDNVELTAEQMRQAYVDWMMERNYTSQQIETVRNLNTNGDFDWNTGVFESFYDFDTGNFKQKVIDDCDTDDNNILEGKTDITLTITGNGYQLTDINHDGKIDSQDIATDHAFYDQNGKENINQLVFNYCDINKDGVLNQYDITDDIKRIMIDGPAIEGGDQYNDLWDMNMDGIITGGIYSYKWDGNNHQDILNFETANGYQGDIDNDGSYGNYFDPNGPYGIKKNIFDQCDINKDGVLDVNDIPTNNNNPVVIDMNLYTITGLNTKGKATDYKTPCYYIKDENGNYGKWRVPNLRELYLMLVAENDLVNGNKGIITGTEVSRTQFRFADKKSTDSGEKRFGWYTNLKEKLTMNPELDAPVDDIEQRYQDVDIRCIRDNNAPAISALSE